MNLINSILGWLFSKLGGFLLNAFIAWIEKQWPGSKAIIDKILEWLGQGVAPAAISAHLEKFEA